MLQETEHYRLAKSRLPEHVCRILDAKVQLLAANPAHPGLQVHRLRNIDAWEAYVGLAHRLIFQQQGDDLLLLDVGKHQLIDRLRRKAG